MESSNQDQVHCGQNVGELETLVKSATKEEQEMKLIHFCDAGNRAAVEFLLSHDVDVNGKDDDGRTALIVSSMHGYDNIVTLILDYVDNVDTCDKSEMTALMYACMNGHKSTSQILISRGSDVDCGCDWNENLPIICAYKNGHSDIAELLILQGADDFTAMMCACEYGCEEAVRLLVRRNVSFEDNFGTNAYSALMIACKHGHENIARFLIENGADVNRCGNDDLTVLNVACSSGHDTIVDLLIHHGAKLNGHGAGDPTDLMWASGNGHVNVVKLLLEHGADPSEQDRYRRNTSLMWASKNSHMEVIKLLLEKGADIHATDCYKQTALHFASGSANVSTLELLIENGADVNAVDRDGMTALKLACMYGLINSVQWLIQCGANVNDCSGGGTPLMQASESGHENVVKFLLSNGAIVNQSEHLYGTALICACKYGHKRIVELLIERGADVNIITSESCDNITATMEACKHGQDKVLDLLIENGADVNTIDIDGKTPLMYACENVTTYWELCGKNGCESGCKECVELLLNHNANIDAQGKDGLSATMLAVKEKHVECLQGLLPYSPNLELSDNEGRTVFSHAMMSKRTDCLKVLLEDGKRLSEGRLIPVYKTKTVNSSKFSLEAVLLTIEFGVFEWDWCPVDHFLPVSLAALMAGLCPGKIKYDSEMEVSPLLLSFINNDLDGIDAFLEQLYFFPKDLRILSTENAIRRLIKNEALLDKINLKPLSLQSWSFLKISESVSCAGHPSLRSQRVDALPIPEKLKKQLKFQIRV